MFLSSILGAKTMTNIGYLFRGYSVLEGNPLDPKKFDPGFKAKIFEATYTGDRKTDDLRYKIPDGVDILGQSACSLSFSSQTIMTSSDYQKSLLAKASVSGSGQHGIVEGSFSASTEYSKMSKTLKKNEKSIISSEATCSVYEGLLNIGTPPKLSRNFLEALKYAAKKKIMEGFLTRLEPTSLEVLQWEQG